MRVTVLRASACAGEEGGGGGGRVPNFVPLRSKTVRGGPLIPEPNVDQSTDRLCGHR